MASSDPPTSRDSSPNSSTQNPPTRPPLDVSNLGLTLRDWETANYTLISLYRLLHHQANKSHELASSSPAAPTNAFKDFSNETRKLRDLWEDHWQEGMHERRKVLVAKRVQDEFRGWVGGE